MRPPAERSAVLLFAMLASCAGAAGAMPALRNTQGGGARQPQPVAIAARAIGLGVLDDALSPGDPRDAQGRHQRAYVIDLTAGRRVRFRVPAGEIDPMLRLEGPDGVRLQNDDAVPGTLDAMIELVPPTGGTYRVIVTSAVPGQTGRFQLRVTTREAHGLGPRLELGQRASALLGDEVLDPDLGAGVALMHFEAQGGSIVRVRVTSREFDTIATVLGPNGQTWVNDDANDLGPDGTERALDSTLVLAIPESGVYQLIVTAYGGRGRGAFGVATSVRPPVVVQPGQLAPAGPFAGPEGRGRILGLYAGVTAYRDQGALYGCADDARLLGEAMRAARLQRLDEQTVLTDGQATRAAFLDGIRGLARRAGPDDVVFVFWSGHGNVTPSGDGEELDGLDETIVLFDGAVTDDELVAALDEVRAGTVVLAIDACHSGGFADDFVRRPGRIGFFSSDEDVLSDTAEPRRAGGYLSWYLRTGVLGHADHKPRDGVLHAGELADFLLDGFVEDHRLMNPEERLDPSQRLVVRRGSVRWNDVLWVYPRNADLAMPAVPEIELRSDPP